MIQTQEIQENKHDLVRGLFRMCHIRKTSPNVPCSGSAETLALFFIKSLNSTHMFLNGIIGICHLCHASGISCSHALEQGAFWVRLSVVNCEVVNNYYSLLFSQPGRFP